MSIISSKLIDKRNEFHSRTAELQAAVSRNGWTWELVKEAKQLNEDLTVFSKEIESLDN